MDGETGTGRRRVIVVVAVVAGLVLVAAALVYNRGGTGDLSQADLRSLDDCRLADDGAVVATFRFRGQVSGGSLSLGARMDVKERGGEVTRGHERFTVSGSFNRRFEVRVEPDEPVEDVSRVRCSFGMADTGLHWPGR